MNFSVGLDEAMAAYSKNGGFLTVKADGKQNTMTVAWGFVGYMWNKPYFIALVRPQRYTKDIIDKADSFTISVPLGKLADELKICGTKSGRDTDKSQVVDFVPAKSVESPVIGGCDIYYECKIHYTDMMKPELMPEYALKMYKDDYHQFYFGEIVECYRG